MSTLVLGATGYVGRRLVAKLPDAHAVSRVDLADPHHAAAVFADWHGNAIVNLAGPAPKHIETWGDAAYTLATHTRIAMNIARFMPANVRLVHVSGTIVYGIPESQPVRENHPRRPTTPYGLGKVLAEDAVAGLRDVWALRVGGIFSMDRREGALYNFLRAAKERRPIRLTAREPISWDIIHLDDVVEAIIRALRVPGQGAVNVSSGEPIDLLSVAQRVARRFDGEIEDEAGVVHPIFQADISKLRDTFGWVPSSIDRRLDEWWKAL